MAEKELKEIHDKCEECSDFLPMLPSKKISMLGTAVIILGVVSNIAALTVPILLSDYNNYKKYFWPFIVFIFVCYFGLSVFYFLIHRKKKQSYGFIKDKIDTILSIFLPESDRKFGLKKVLTKVEFKNERINHLNSARKRLVLVGINLRNTLADPDFRNILIQKVSDVKNDFRVDFVVCEKKDTFPKSLKNRIDEFNNCIEDIMEMIPKHSHTKIRVKHSNDDNLNYIMCIDDTDIFIRFNLEWDVSEKFKTGFFHFVNDSKREVQDFFDPIKQYVEMKVEP